MLRKPLLTTREVAGLLKVKEATVRRWIRNGELPAVHIGREWRVATVQLEAFVEALVVRPPRAPKTARLTKSAAAGQSAVSNKPKRAATARNKPKSHPTR